uniref:tenascin-R-like n=1 Tax=Ciona intestinalis TaxID=7719 RepID=UPI00089DAFB4|nr:tenascin-R-like [Ciona intestinalis]|eukprot:XP_018668975.1 tenascin-R-like [Ciona intestinalis]
MWPVSSRTTCSKGFCIYIFLLLFILFPSTTIGLRREIRNVTQVGNIGEEEVVFNHIYTINVPDQQQCDCPSLLEGITHTNDPTNPAVNDRFRLFPPPGYVTPSADDVDSKGHPLYAAGFTFRHNINIAESSCPCQTSDLESLQEENLNLRQLMQEMESKLVRRIQAIETKVKKVKLHKCRRRCVDSPAIDIIDRVSDTERATTMRPLSFDSCPRRCSGNGKCISGLCQCDRGYQGDDCSESICVNACSGHGACNKHGRCQCWGQWSGEDCSLRSCPNDCSGNGICDNGLCVCDVSYSGADCSRRSCLNDCNGHGRCNEDTGQCRCHGSWEGPECSAQRCLRDCSGNGDCLNGRCQCDEPWTGKACRILKCPNQCSSNGKCRNGTCVCRNEWTGDDCSSPKCPDDCSGLGECRSGVCECTAGWGGLNCSQPMCVNDCSNNGQCIDGRCRCWGGWEGNSCSHVIKPSGLEISNIQPTTIDVSWSKTSPAITGSQVNCIPMEGTANAVYQSVGPNVTKLTIRDLDSGTQYSVYVYAMIDESLSAPITASVKTGVDTPSQLSYIRIGATFAEITWKPPKAKIDKYKMVCSCKQGGAEFVVQSNKTSVLIKDLSPGETYSVALYAVQGENVSTPININFTTSLDAPKSVEFIDVTSTSATAWWVPSVAKITGYKFALVQFDGQNIVEDQVTSTSRMFTFTNLKPRTRYNFTIHSIRGEEHSVPLHANLITGLEPPVNFSLTKVLPNMVSFKWDSPNARIKRFRISIFQELSYNEDATPISSIDLPHHTYKGTFNDLIPGTKYVVEVVSVEHGVESGPLVKHIMTGIDAPTNLRIASTTPTSVSVTWSKPHADVEGYSVECLDVRRGARQEIKLSGDEWSATFTSLRPATEYNITIQAELDDISSTKVWRLTYTTLPQPQNIRVSSPTFDDLVVIWDPVIVFQQRRIMGVYDVRIQPVASRYSAQNGRVLEFTIPGDNTALNVPGMTAGLTYNVSIVAKTTNNILPPSPPVLVSYLAPVDPPQGVTLTHVGHNNVTLHWFPPSAAITGYLVEYQDLYSTSDVHSLTIPANQTYVSITNLIDDTSYVINVTSVMYDRESVSSTIMFTTEMMIIEPPEYLHTTEIKHKSIGLEWMESLSENIDGYFVAYMPLHMHGQHENTTLVGDKTSTVLQGLTPGTEYLINVFTVYNERVSIPVQLSVTTAIDPPTRLMFVTVSDSSFTIHWQQPIAMVANYIVTYYRSSSTGERQDIIIPGGETVCSIHNLVPATEYTVEIYAMGNSTQSDPTMAMVVTLPASVSQLRSPKQGINHVIMTWEKPMIGGEITGYKVDYHARDNVLNIRSIHLESNHTRTAIRGLNPATVYLITVYSKRHLDLSEGTTVTQGTLIPPVHGVAVLPIDEKTIHVQWKSPPNVKVEGYTVSYKPLDEFSQTMDQVVKGDETSAVITGLLADTQYAVTVHANVGDLVAKKRQIKATTASSLESPETLRITNIRDTSAHVRWDPVIDKTVTGYLLRYKPVGGSTEDEVKVGLKGRKKVGHMLMKLRPGVLYYVSVATERHERVSFPPVTERFVTSQMLTAPVDVVVRNITESSVSLEWPSQYVDGIEEYHMTYSVLGGGETNEIITASPETMIATIEGLLPGRSYTINIRSFRWGVDSADATSITITTLHPLLPPRDLILDGRNQTEARIRWTPTTPDADAHHITLSSLRGGGSPFSVRLSPTSGMANFKDLKPGTRYRVTLVTMRGNQSSDSRVLKFRTDERLDSPSNITVSLMGENGANITWKISQQKYDRIYFSYSSDDETESNSTFLNRKMTHIILTHLTPDTLYHATIACKYKRKTSPLKMFSFTTDYIIPSPTRIQFTAVNKTRLTVRWRKASNRAQYYRIAYKDEHRMQRTVTISGRSTRLPLEYLQAGTSYNVSVTALGRNKESLPLVGKVTTLLNPPSKLNATSTTSASVQLTWEPPLSPVDGFVIKYHELVSRKISRRPSVIVKSNLKVIHVKNNTTVNVTGLVAGTKYVFQVVARKDGREAYSMRVVQQTDIAPPRNLRTSVTSRRSANLTWDFANMTQVTGYLVNVTAVNSTFNRAYNVKPQTSYVFLQNLLPGVEYNVDVTTLCKLDKSRPVQVHFKTAKVPYPKPKDCVQVLRNGETLNKVYEIYPYNGITLKVFCDLHTDGGGWLTFQRRQDGSLSFHRSWDEYMSGFGNLTKEFWIGLQTLHELTMTNDQTLRIDMRYKDEVSYAVYRNFSLSDAATGFMLHASGYTGTAGDSLSYHDGMKFTTYDRDNDDATNRNCAKEYKGAWWFKNCHRSSLNGLYGNSRHSQGVNWYSWGGFTRSIEFVEMKLRPQSFIQPTVKPAIMRRFEAIVS